MSSEQLSSIIPAVNTCAQNRFRKAYIIMLASLIEQLFNDYFTELINLKLSSFWKRGIFSKIQYSRNSTVIDITDSFLDEPLKTNG